MADATPRRNPVAALVRALGDRRATPDDRWVSALTGRPIVEVRRAIRGLADHLEVEEAIRAAHRAGGREFYAQICAPFELYALVRLAKPQEVVETGVSSGVSSTHFLLGLRDNGAGRLHSIDLPVRQEGPTLGRGESTVSVPPGRPTGWVVPTPLRTGWDLRLGPSQELLPRLLAELPRVDLFLHDDLHTPTHLAFELELLRPRLRPGSIVLADNTNWTGKAFDRFARSIGAPVVRRRGSDLVGARVPGPSGLPKARAAPPRRRAARPRSR
jgi:hypothetical protein